MTTAITFSRQNDAGSRAHYLLLRKSRTRCRPRLKGFDNKNKSNKRFRVYYFSNTHECVRKMPTKDI